jgi:hypothetical protein
VPISKLKIFIILSHFNQVIRACYEDGKLMPCKEGENTDPRPCAGNVGTQITVNTYHKVIDHSIYYL